MKYISRYIGPLLENADADDEDLLDLEALGLLPPEYIVESRRAKFIDLLKDLFSRIGIPWRDVASNNSRSRGTLVPQLTQDEAYQLVMGASPEVIQNLSRNRATKLIRLIREITPLGDRVNQNKTLTYWIQPTGVRAQYHGRYAQYHSMQAVSSFIKFDGKLKPEEILALFVNQVAVDLSPQLID